MDGSEVLARWRETGEWWAEASQREYVRYIDHKGNRREKAIELARLGLPNEVIYSAPDTCTEDFDLILRKRRDEKVARACGFIRDPRVVHLLQDEARGTLVHAVSGYTFGRSVMMAEEIPAHAALRGYRAALLADRFSLAGVREFSRTAEKVGVKPLLGATVELEDGSELVLVIQNATGYRNLSQLITECHLKEPRSFPLCTYDRLARRSEGLIVLTAGDAGATNRSLVKRDVDHARSSLRNLVATFGRQNVYVQIERSYLPWEICVNRQLAELAGELGLPVIAGGPTTHLDASSFPAQDVLVCVETLCLADEIDGRKPHRAPDQPAAPLRPRRALNSERYMRTIEEVEQLFADHPEWVRATDDLADRCEVGYLPGMMEMPRICANEPDTLAERVMLGATIRYPHRSRSLEMRIKKELERIIRLGFCNHFLIAEDMCNWATEHGHLFSGRGSVVDSVVAYCLGLSRIDAYAHSLHFDRFLPDDGSKRPDIDIDFEARSRNDVRQYLVRKYGEDHVATVAAFGAYQSRGIIRDVGKVLGIPPEWLVYLKKRLHGGVTPDRLREAIESKPELRGSDIKVERYEWVFRLSSLLMDVPTNIRAHSSGVIISREPIANIVPVMLSGDDAVRIIQWDKRSAKYSFDKFDVLCLRGNDVLSGTQARVRTNSRDFDVLKIPLDDEETYRTMRSGQLIGIPQSASPAMRQAHIRLKTANLVDASLVQAGIRPGVGGAVKLNELIARRRGKPYTFSHPKMEEILGHTYGIIVFQEQVDQLLQVFGGYTSGEAETTREAIHKKRREQYAIAIREEVEARVMANGFCLEIAREVFEYVSGFQGYGFAQGHALAFAEVSIRSIWCQQNYPAEYFAALLDAQPAGYYGPRTIANEARIRGVAILHPDVNLSGEKYIVEDVRAKTDPQLIIPNGGLRVSLRQISGLSGEARERIVQARVTSGQYESFFDFVHRTTTDRDELELLIQCGAFDSLHPNRRALLWSIPAAQSYATTRNSSALPLGWEEPVIDNSIPDFSPGERAIRERSILDMDVNHHLMAFERPRVMNKRVISAAEASAAPIGTKMFVVGNPIRLRFPPTQSGKRVLFFDLEDETGLLNVTCFDAVYQRYGHTIVCSPYLTLYGEAQDRDGHTAFLTHHVYPYRPRLDAGVRFDSVEELPVVRADFLVG